MDYRKDWGNILLNIFIFTLLKVGHVDGNHGVSGVVYDCTISAGTMHSD